MNPVVAHMGGADEVAFVIIPLAVTVLLSWFGRRRAADEKALEDEVGHGSELGAKG